MYRVRNPCASGLPAHAFAASQGHQVLDGDTMISPPRIQGSYHFCKKRLSVSY